MAAESLLAVYQELRADWATREPALSKMGGLGRAAWSEWAAEGDWFGLELPYPSWVKAVTADLIKVGPKGYIHGWIYVGPAKLTHPFEVHHPELGTGKVTRRGSKTIGVQFHSGAYHAFEHKPETPDAAEHFITRPGHGAWTGPEERARRDEHAAALEAGGSAARVARAREAATHSWSGNPYSAMRPMEALTDADWRSMSDEDKTAVREALDRLQGPRRSQPGDEIHTRAGALAARLAATPASRPKRYTDKQKLAIWDAMPADERSRWLGLGKGPEDITPGNIRAGLVPAELTSPPARAPRVPKPAAKTPDEHRAHLATLTSRDEARAYVAPLKGKELDALARDLSVDHHRTVAERRDAIVESTVGARTDAEAIRGGNWLKPAVPEHLMESAPTVPVSRLRAGDYAKVTGEDQYGRPTTLTGYVSNPTPVRIGSRRGKKQDAMAVQVTETRGGANGWRGAVYVAPDAHVTPMPEPTAPEPAHEPLIRPDISPVGDARGTGLTPGDTVTVASSLHNRTDEKATVLDVGTSRVGGHDLATVRFADGSTDQILAGNLVRSGSVESAYLTNLSRELANDPRFTQPLRNKPPTSEVLRTLAGAQRGRGYESAVLQQEARRHRGTPLGERLSVAAGEVELLRRGNASPELLGRAMPALEPAAPSPRMQAEALRVEAAARQRALDAGLPAAGSTSRRHHTPAGPVGAGRGDTAAGWAGRVHEQQRIDELNARAEQVAATPTVASELTRAAEDRILSMDRPGAPAHIRETAASIRERRAAETPQLTGHVARDAQIRSGWKTGDRLIHANRGPVIYGEPDERDSTGRAGGGGAQHVEFEDDGNGGMVSANMLSGYVPSPEDATRARQSEIDQARAVGGLVAETHELVNHQASPEAIRSRLTAHGNRVGVDAAPLAVLAHDPPALLHAADEMGTRANLERVGSAGEVVPFNPRAHDPLGQQLREGSNVEVVRPGHVATLASGERVPVSKATVMPAGTPEAPARISVQPRGRRPAALKQPPEPAAPATQYQVIQVNSRGKTTAVLGHAASKDEAAALRQHHIDRINNGPENQRRRNRSMPIVDAAHDIKIEERVPGQGQTLDPITAPKPAKLPPTEAAQQALQRLRAGNPPEATLKTLLVDALRELARIHGIVGSLGGRDEVKRMKKADLVREMTPWF